MFDRKPHVTDEGTQLRNDSRSVPTIRHNEQDASFNIFDLAYDVPRLTAKGTKTMPHRTLGLLVVSIVALQAQVTHDRLLNAAKEPQNWLTY